MNYRQLIALTIGSVTHLINCASLRVFNKCADVTCFGFRAFAMWYFKKVIDSDKSLWHGPINRKGNDMFEGQQVTHNGRKAFILSIDSDPSVAVWIAYEGTDTSAFVSRSELV